MQLTPAISALLLLFASSSTLVDGAKAIVFTVVNDKTNNDLFELNNGSIVDLNKFDFKSLVIRADISTDPSSVKKVVFELDGIKERTDPSPPFIVGGGVKPSGIPKQPILTPGKHKLKASAILKNGEVKTRVVNFEVWDPTIAPTTVPIVSLSLTLVDSTSDNDADMDPLMQDSVIDLSKVGMNLNIRADIGYNITAMDFWFDGEYIRTEFVEPFALGGNRFEDYFKFASLAVTGQHEMSVRAFVGTELVGQRRISFYVIDKTFTPTVTKYPTWAPTGPPNLSDQPSEMPSDVPSDVPSDTLSDVPSDTPSDAPSDVPSDVQSDMPSVPSDMPSNGSGTTNSPTPSDKPVVMPSSSPSIVETTAPAEKPPINYVTKYFVSAGKDIEEPQYFIGKKTQAYTNEDANIKGADPYKDSVFQTHRCADWMNYTFPGMEPKSMNQVKLGFAEVYDRNCDKGPGARVIDVTVNDESFLSKFDILKVASCYEVHFHQGLFLADDFGQVSIGFTASKGSTFVSMIEIETVVNA